MATLTCVYDATRPRDARTTSSPRPAAGAAAERCGPGPRATAKWLAGSVEHDPADMIAAAFDQAEARDPQHHKTWVVLVDGAEHQLDLIRCEAWRRGVTIHVVIDLIHVLEYIWKAAWSLHAAGDPAAEDWVAAKALAVLAGDSARAAAEISAEADTAGLAGTQRTGSDACIRYLTSKDEYLRYDQALTAGWPIATGVIEGACRHLIGDRLDVHRSRSGSPRRRSDPHPARRRRRRRSALRYSALMGSWRAGGLACGCDLGFCAAAGGVACTLWVRGRSAGRGNSEDGRGAAVRCWFEGEERPGSGRLRVTTPCNSRNWSALRHAA